MSDLSAMMCLVTEKPEPREVNSWQVAEVNAAAWMRHWGFPDARVTGSGSDAGIDVRSARALAQVKRESKPVGRPAVQNLLGARGRDASLQPFFFSSSGYTHNAIEFGSELGVALFRYDRLGSMTAVNSHAHRVIDRAREPVPTIEDPGPNATVRRMTDEDEVEVFYFRATRFQFTRAMLRMHRMGGGGEKRAVQKDRRITIAPGWVAEYAGLVSLSAKAKHMSRGDDPVIRVQWSSHSNATPETMDRVTQDARAAMERALDLLAQFLGPPIPRPAQGGGRNGTDDSHAP